MKRLYLFWREWLTNPFLFASSVYFNRNIIREPFNMLKAH